MKIGVYGHSIAIFTNQSRIPQNIESWPGWTEIVGAQYSLHGGGTYHMSHESAAFEICDRAPKREYDVAVVFWAFPVYYWFPKVPQRDFAFYSPSERLTRIKGARGIRKGTDFDESSVKGTNFSMDDLVQANMLYQEFHEKHHLWWRSQNALLRLETQARSQKIPIVHYFHPKSGVPDWLDIISGPVEFGEIGSMQDQAEHTANFNNCNNRLNRKANEWLAERVVSDCKRALKWYDTPEETRIENYRKSRETWKQRQKTLDYKLLIDDTDEPEIVYSKRHNKGAGQRPNARTPVLTAKEVKRRAKAAKLK